MGAYKNMQESLQRAQYIRGEIRKANKITEKKKYESLHFYYIETIKEIIRQGDRFLDTSDNLDVGLEVIQIIENYNCILSMLKEREWDK